MLLASKAPEQGREVLVAESSIASTPTSTPSAATRNARSAMHSESVYNRSVHRLSVTLTIAVFPLIWVGGLVTTYDAGMAVPDWPGTYGWNMLAYPVSTWLFGPFDLLVEHSHRLLGTLAGILSIALVWAAWRQESRVWFKLWSVFVLVSVIAQGGLGGARVLLDQRTFAMIHGCTGPLFFAISTGTAVMSSRWWVERLWARSEAKQASEIQPRSGAGVTWLATTLVLVSYLQLILGAQLRHVTGVVSHRVFTGFVHMHLTLAGLVLLLAIGLSVLAGWRSATPKRVVRAARLLTLVVLVQISLGIGTWIVNYALPWPELNETLAGYTILAKGYWESLIVTAHMATGSLIISLATVVALRAWRSRSVASANG